jgi:hypothetical protein
MLGPCNAREFATKEVIMDQKLVSIAHRYAEVVRERANERSLAKNAAMAERMALTVAEGAHIYVEDQLWDARHREGKSTEHLAAITLEATEKVLMSAVALIRGRRLAQRGETA